MQPLDLIVFVCGMLAGAGSLILGVFAWWVWSDRRA